MPTELEDELRELRREIVESRSLIIKTNNLTNTLSADLKAITRRQQSFDRRISWNSATAYLVFVVVVLLFVKVAWDYRVESGRSELEGAKNEVDQLRKKNKELQGQTETKSRVESKGQVLYELMRAGKRAEFLEQFDTNVKETLSRTELLIFRTLVRSIATSSRSNDTPWGAITSPKRCSKRHRRRSRIRCGSSPIRRLHRRRGCRSHNVIANLIEVAMPCRFASPDRFGYGPRYPGRCRVGNVPRASRSKGVERRQTTCARSSKSTPIARTRWMPCRNSRSCSCDTNVAR